MHNKYVYFEYNLNKAFFEIIKMLKATNSVGEDVAVGAGVVGVDQVGEEG